jgi:hypothetical protein
MLIKFKKELLLFVFSLGLLFCSYQFGIFSVVDVVKPGAFERFQYSSDSLVFGKIAQSRNEGILSYQGRLGRLHFPGGKVNENTSQKLILNQMLYGGSYQPYNSNFGLQGVFYSLVDKALKKLSIDFKNRVFIYHAITSFLLAVVLAFIILFFYLELGMPSAIFLLFALAFEQWLILIGKSLFWSFWVFYVPFLITFIFHKFDEVNNNINFNYFYLSIFTAIFFKSLTGYEFISSVMVASLTPIVYFSIKNQWGYFKTIKRILLTGICGFLGFLTALVAHMVQLWFTTQSFLESFGIIFRRAVIRTHGDAYDSNNIYYEDSLSSSLFTVYKIYLKGMLGETTIMMIIFIVASIISFTKLKIMKKNFDILKALTITLWFSFLAPMSWFTLAKGHSFDHSRLNHVLWNLPFNIFGFALVGLVLYILYKEFFNYLKLHTK